MPRQTVEQTKSATISQNKVRLCVVILTSWDIHWSQYTPYTNNCRKFAFDVLKFQTYVLSFYIYWWFIVKVPTILISSHTMTSSNRNIFRVTGPLWGESIGDRRIPLTNASEKLCCFISSAPQQTVEQTMETTVIWDTIMLIMTSL